MDPLTAHIQKLADKIVRRMNQESRSTETRAAALYELRKLGPDIERVQSDVERTHFIESWLAEERARFSSETTSDLPSWVDRDDDVRDDDEPLCSCHLDCGIKQGKLPPKIPNADSFEAGVREFKHSHPGNPTALDEANKAWRQKQAHVRERLQTVLAALADDSPVWDVDTSVPDPSPDDEGSSDGDEQPTDEDGDTGSEATADGSSGEASTPADD